MTAVRVLNPVALSEFCKMRASPTTVGRNSPCGRQLNRIKRDLFGPANPMEINKIFTEELEKHQERAINKWGFDFRNGVPACTNSQYIWERVSCQESNVAPEMYTLTRAAHVRPDQIESSTYDELMDERSERENLANISGATDASGEESQDESLPIAFKAPVASGSAKAERKPSAKANLRKRQPKITEYMKERKRLAQTPKKDSPAKRMRSSSGSSSNSSLSVAVAAGVSHSAQANSISSHFSLRSNLQRRH